MRLHSNMCVQVIEGAVRLLAALPPTFVHSLNLFIATSWALVLLCARNGNERVNLRERVRWLFGETKYNGSHGNNANCLPDQSAVQRWMGFLGQMRPSPGNCMDQAFRVDDRHSAEASAEGILAEARGPDIVTCRVARTVSREDR